MSRRKADKPISSNPTRFEVEQTEREEVAPGRLAGAPPDMLGERLPLPPQRHDPFATLEDRLAYERHLRDTAPAMSQPAVQGLTDDPSARVAEAVYAHVFAATWVKRQDLSTPRRLVAAKNEAGTAAYLARHAYSVDATPSDSAEVT